jgi:hypothetical protein
MQLKNYCFARVLEVSLRPRTTSRAGIAALSKLQSLQQFLFIKFERNLSWSRSRRSRFSHLLNLCFDLLPQLYIVAFDPQRHPDSFYDNWLDMVTAKALSDLGPLQRTLQLRRLMLSNNVPENINLPELRHLHLVARCSLFRVTNVRADRFPRLSRLVMHGHWRRNELMLILSRVGRQLTALDLLVDDGVDLDMLLSECPDLSELSLNAFGVHSSSELQPHTLRRLQDLQIIFNAAFYDHQPHLLVDLLRLAPRLRIVKHALMTVHIEVFEQLFLLAKRRTSMRHLEQLKVYIMNQNLDSVHSALIGEVILKFTIECEQLKTAQLAYRRISE